MLLCLLNPIIVCLLFPFLNYLYGDCNVGKNNVSNARIKWSFWQRLRTKQNETKMKQQEVKTAELFSISWFNSTFLKQNWNFLVHQQVVNFIKLEIQTVIDT